MSENNTVAVSNDEIMYLFFHIYGDSVEQINWEYWEKLLPEGFYADVMAQLGYKVEYA